MEYIKGEIIDLEVKIAISDYHKVMQVYEIWDRTKEMLEIFNMVIEKNEFTFFIVIAHFCNNKDAQ
jgi:hypothetical protein